MLGTFRADVTYTDIIVKATFHVIPGNALSYYRLENAARPWFIITLPEQIKQRTARPISGAIQWCRETKRLQSKIAHWCHCNSGRSSKPPHTVPCTQGRRKSDRTRRWSRHSEKNFRTNSMGLAHCLCTKTENRQSPCLCCCASSKQSHQTGRHSMPTLDELISELSGASVFLKLDLNQGYNQLELDKESRYITTFATHVGLRRYIRLFFGINSAADVFQEAIHYHSSR